MSLAVRIEGDGDVLRVRLEGQLTLGPALRAFSEKVSARLAAEAPRRGVVVHLGAVTKIDSAGLGELMAVYSSAMRRQCRIALSGVSAQQREMFRVLRLERILPAFDEEAAAVAYVRES